MTLSRKNSTSEVEEQGFVPSHYPRRKRGDQFSNSFVSHQHLGELRIVAGASPRGRLATFRAISEAGAAVT
ncbi:unnamed protein product [Euphydryas editha]|uniref:Uncharacterized protein n=1 Tax=Euphydryas editha TaxID=104508 RepID=A0AAU9TXK1_EUPED|nr:unnamed protein product [Euphydryas editha]